MSAQPFERPAAKSLEEVDTHVRYAQASLREIKDAVDKVVAALPSMATKDYIDKRFDRFEEQYASKTVTDALSNRVATVESQLQSGSVGSTLDRWLTTATKWFTFLASMGALAGVIYAAVHFIDRVPK